MESIRNVEKIRKFNRFYANVLGKIDQEIYNRPYTLTEARVLTEINSREGYTATEIRETLGIDRGYMSRIIQRFEEEKIIIKKRSSDDKRQYLLYLTDYGKEILKGLVENANREIAKMIQAMPKRDQAKLVTSMETIESILSGVHPSHSEVSIRSFQPGDVGYVAYLHGKLYHKTYGFGRTFEYYVMKGLTEFLENSEGGDLWVAEVNGEIAGSIAITQSSEQIAQLRWFVVDENYQGLGIGKKLMDTAIAFCRKRGYQHVFLWTVSILDTARHLYQKYNFKLTEEKPNETWTGTKLIKERWDLTLTDEKTVS
jgi:DNA-binding MarR family transcriptional regulator/N-acetylglutamate synthase-like GNAT family acetyltransferase